MADFCLKCFNKINGTNYKRYDVIEEYGICEECASYRNVVVDIIGYGVFGSITRTYKRLFPKQEPIPIKVEAMNAREINDCYLCGLDYCDKELKDNIPPCAECEHCIDKENILDF